ncbi:MAG: hypothetical protein V4439_04230 [Patescibacteria group bacterium]
MQSETKTCQNCNSDFIIEPNDFGFYEKVKVPPPTFCPRCRMQRRFTWRNNLSFYSRPCALCNKSGITLYSPDSGITVYCNKCWFGDKWDPKSYAQDYDFSKPFFTQFLELLKRVPQVATVNDDGIASLNCQWTHDCWFAKNCYMVFYSWQIENIMYSTYMLYGAKDMMDCMYIMDKAEWLYECINCESSYRLKYAQLCISCVDSSFMYDCRGCTNCFMCTGLRNEKYCFKNQRYTKEDYEKILAEYKLDTYAGTERAKKEFKEFLLSYPRRYAYIIQSKNCTGDLIFNGKDSKDVFSTQQPENCRFMDGCAKPTNSYDLSTAGEMTECYDGVTVDHSQLNLFGIFSVKSQELHYTQHCHSSKNLFGCVSMKKGNYCILNKQYSKEDYFIMVEKIKKQMEEIPYIDKNGCKYSYGEFYPAELSLFGYNETSAMEEFPLTKEQALARGFKWQDNTQRTTGKETLLPENIPDAISDVGDDILEQVLKCIDCERNYKIVPNELIFYKKMNIPVPHRCFHCRHAARIKRRNPFKLWHRQCMCQKENHDHSGIPRQGGASCPNEFETSYAPERPEIIYCEQCYQKEVY